jgi:hypothetical protein
MTGLQRNANFLNCESKSVQVWNSDSDQKPQCSEQYFHLNYSTLIFLLFKLIAVQTDGDTFDGTARVDFQHRAFSLTYRSASLAFVLP